MTATITHTPYDGTSKPFAIGLKQAEPRDWIELDGHLEAYLAEKDRLYETIPEKVFVAEPETRDAQREVLDLLVAHLAERFPETYHLDGGRCTIAGTGRSIDVDNPGDDPLVAASKLVQEDLILMRPGENGWRLAAGSLCFPSSWKLTEKFGLPMHDIHQPVPGFGPGTRMAELIARMFDKLAVLVERFNWSIQSDRDLYHPLSDREPHCKSGREHVELSGQRRRRPRLHPRRAADATQAAPIGRHPVHHPHLSRPAGGSCPPRGPGAAGRVLRRTAHEPRPRPARLQGPCP